MERMHKSEAELVVERQLDAYNAHDLERFVAEYDDDIEIYRLPGSEPIMRGVKELSDFYAANRFNRPNLHAKIAGRLVFGNMVIDHEQITGVNDDVLELAAIYEVTNGKIKTVRFVSAG